MGKCWDNRFISKNRKDSVSIAFPPLPAFLLLFISLCLIGTAQQNDLSQQLMVIAEELAGGDEEYVGTDLLMDQLLDLMDNRVKINTGNESEITRLFFLSDFQVRSLAGHIRTTGKVLSAYELALIPGFDRSVAEMMIPFIDLSVSENNSIAAGRVRNSLLVNTIINPGEYDSTFLGSPVKILGRYKFTWGNMGGGFTTEKDRGEKFFPGKNRSPEFLSGNLYWNGKGTLRKIVLGDYSASFGLGTAINTGIRPGLSLSNPGYLAGKNVIRPYTSAEENNFLRGLALEFSAKNISLTGFLSRNRIDATIIPSADSSASYAESLYSSGLHATVSQLDKKDELSVTAMGFNLSFNNRLFTTGITWLENRFSHPLSLNTGYAYKNLYFNDITNRVISTYFKTQVKGILLYGEASGDKNMDMAVLTGLSTRLGGRANINMRYFYDSGFTSFFNGSGGVSSHQEAFTGGFVFEAARSLFLSGGAEIIKYSWIRYRANFPSDKIRKELTLRYSPKPELNIGLTAGSVSSMLNSNRDRGVPGIALRNTFRLRSYLILRTSPNLTLHTRFSLTSESETGSKGFALAQDLIYHWEKPSVSLWSRYCLFSTGSWDTRLYLYENDLVYSFNIPSLSGEGSRSYLMLSWKPSEQSEIRAKYSIIQRDSETGTGINDELRLQIRWQF